MCKWFIKEGPLKETWKGTEEEGQEGEETNKGSISESASAGEAVPGAEVPFSKMSHH